jgi:type VI secretion system protein ImpA
MPLFDLDALLAPVSDDAPGGPDLEHDAAFIALGRLSQPTPERTVRVLDPSSGREVDRVIAGKEADHRAVLPAALALLARSRDLRVAMLLLPAATRADGLGGYAAVTRLLLGLCQVHWSTLHPQLDPDDELDPTMRINILADYADQQLGLQALRGAPLAEARSVGRFCVRDLEVAAGELGPFEGQAGATRAALVAACQGAAAEELAARQVQAAAALADLEALEALFQQQAGRGPDFGAPKKLLQRVLALYREAAGAAEDGPAAEPAPAAQQELGGGARAAAAPCSRGDARRLLAQACDWLERAEPAHPAPLLVRRAIRLLDMNFLDIMRELTPDAVAEIERLGGVKHE